MHVRTAPVTVLAYGTWSDETDPDPIKWGSGALVETVTFMDAADPENPRQITLAESVNGARLPAMSRVELVCVLTPASQTFDLANGRQRTVKRDKWKCVDMLPAAAGEAPAEQSKKD
jgi:hypothetical protein